MELRKWIRDNRKRLKLSPSELAKKIAYARRTYESLEAGTIECSFDTFSKLLDIFGFLIIDIDSLNSFKELLRKKTRDLKIHQNEELGDIIKKVREQRGWTQEDLSEKTGISTSTIINIEKNRDAYFSTIKKILNILGITFLDLENFKVANSEIFKEVSNIKATEIH